MAAYALDASDCASAAGKLRREARDLEDAASSLSSASDAIDRQSRERQVASAVDQVEQYARRTMRDCGGSNLQAPSIPASIVLEQMQMHLIVRFGAGEATDRRLKESRDALEAVARIHERVRARDFVMTLAIAEAVFQQADAAQPRK